MSSTREGWYSFGGVAWLFTIGFLDLDFWQAVWALVAWTYYLGVWAAWYVSARVETG